MLLLSHHVTPNVSLEFPIQACRQSIEKAAPSTTSATPAPTMRSLLAPPVAVAIAALAEWLPAIETGATTDVAQVIIVVELAAEVTL